MTSPDRCLDGKWKMESGCRPCTLTQTIVPTRSELCTSQSVVCLSRRGHQMEDPWCVSMSLKMVVPCAWIGLERSRSAQVGQIESVHRAWRPGTLDSGPSKSFFVRPRQGNNRVSVMLWNPPLGALDGLCSSPSTRTRARAKRDTFLGFFASQEWVGGRNQVARRPCQSALLWDRGGELPISSVLIIHLFILLAIPHMSFLKPHFVSSERSDRPSQPSGRAE
ncbi:hypothetical protein CLAIMM_04954 [Cladophialophora immunda]|nr:hypothetical protein CLAIMM_04954 [Cladophialophora immunda]